MYKAQATLNLTTISLLSFTLQFLIKRPVMSNKYRLYLQSYFTKLRVVVVLLLFFCLTLSSTSYAQFDKEDNKSSDSELCATDIIHQRKLAQDPEYREKMERMEQQLNEYIQEYIQGAIDERRVGNVIIIPLVFHIMHTGGPIGSIYNPTDAKINAMVAYLNQMYSNQAPFNTVGGVDIEVQFELAQRTGNCMPTNGINRIDASIIPGYQANGISLGGPGVSEVAVKDLSRWSNIDYYNIWIVNKLDGANGTSGTFTTGYAYFPGAAPNIDGTVMLATQMDPGDVTLPHEIGHALRLYHTFQESTAVGVCPPNANCAAQGDQVCDTAPHDRNNFQCSSNVCSPDLSVLENIMSYSNCRDKLTLGQKIRMRAALETQRPGLISSLGGIPPPASLSASACTPTITTPSFFGIARVRFNTIDVVSSHADNEGSYVDRSCNQGTTVFAGSTHTLNINSSFINSHKVRAYIDYNNDGDFTDPGEEILVSNSGTLHTSNVVIPMTGVPFNQPLRMRVVGDFVANPNPNSCSVGQGQAEDFSVIIRTNLLCDITAITAGTQTPCNVTTNQYTQELTIVYNNEPPAGSLVVNGQSFPLTGSPQTVTLIGLDSDGLAVDVTATFSDNLTCPFTASSVFTAPVACQPMANIGTITPTTYCAGETISIPFTPSGTFGATNTFTAQLSSPTGSFAVPIATQVGVSPILLVIPTTAVTGTGYRVRVLSSDPVVISSSTTDITINAIPLDRTIVANPNTVSLNQSSNIEIPNSQLGVTYQLQDVSAGNVNIGTPVAGTGGIISIPTGNLTVTTDFRVVATSIAGCERILNTVTVTVDPCTIISVTAGNQTSCSSSTNEYTQEVVLTYISAPLNGDVIVNGQNFTITSSPQTVVLTGLVSDGNPVDVTVSFSAQPTCSFAQTNVFTAPSSCLPEIVLDPIVSTQYCIGQTINVGFTTIITAGSFGAGNIFTAELSNSSGDFTVPIASQSGTSPINLTIPLIAPQGTGYRVRVRASSPTLTISNVSTAISINTLPNNLPITATVTTLPVGTGTTISVANTQTGVTYALQNVNNGNGIVGTVVNGTGGIRNFNTGNLNTTTVFRVWATNITTGCSIALGPITINVTGIVPCVITAPADITLDNDLNQCDAENFIINGFTADFTPSNWTVTLQNSDGQIDTSNAPTSILMIGSDNGGGAGITTYSTTVPVDGFISFNWDYFTVDVNGAAYDIPFYTVGTGPDTNFPDYNTGGSNIQSGGFFVPVSAGDVFAIGVLATDNILGAAEVTISDFSFTTIDAPLLVGTCPGASITNDAPATFPVGNTQVTWSVTDLAGFNSTAIQNITVVDVQNPTITAPADITVTTSAGNCQTTGINLGTPTVNDNCINTTITNDAPLSFAFGANTVTWTVTDNAGNTSTATQTVTIIDSEPPTITAPADVTANTDTGVCTASGVVLGTPTGSDNCGTPTFTNNAPPVFPIGVTVVIWTATDAVGNTAQAQQLVTVTDNENPTIVPTDVNVLCPSDVVLGTPTTNDNCGVASVTNNAPTVFSYGITTVTWTVTDFDGNTATADQIITVIDTQNPTVSTPADVLVECPEDVVLVPPTDNDNCAVISLVNDAPTIFPYGMTTVTWTVTDESGNIATSSHVVTVEDVTNPIITVTNLIVSCDAPVVLGVPTTNDNCGVASVSNDAPATYSLGTTNVTWTVTDDFGNITTVIQTVTIIDTQAPTIVAPADVTVDTDAGICTASGVALGTPTTADNCGVASITNDTPATFPLGTTNVTWTVTDNAGNIATATQTITVIDAINPTIANPTAINLPTDVGVCATTHTLTPPVADDNCSVASLVNDAPATFPIGITTVVWTATDGSGNITTTNQTVVIEDTENPTISTPTDITFECPQNVVLVPPTTNDNCAVAGLVNDAPTVFPYGMTTVNWTVTDQSGNTATSSNIITVEDVTNPTITVTNLTVSCDAPVVLGTPTTADNCGVAGVTNDAPATYPLGTTDVTWTVTDNSGNIATAIQTVTVIDTQNPTITPPLSVVVETDAGVCTASGVVLGTPTTADNCGVASVTNDAPAIYSLGITNVTWTVTDNAGNVATTIQPVTVLDRINPTMVNPATVNLLTDIGFCTAAHTLAPPATSDNCSVASVTNNAPTAFPIGTTTVIWTATDGSGNVVEKIQTVNVTRDPFSVVVMISSSDTVICSNETTTFEATGGTNYIFYRNGVQVATGSIYSPPVGTLQNNDKIWVIGESNNCPDTTRKMTVIVNPLPVIDLGVDKFKCKNDTTIIVVAPTNANYIYDWKKLDAAGNPVSVGNGNDTLFVSGTGTYFVDVTNTVTSCTGRSNRVKVINYNDEVVVDLGEDKTVCDPSDLPYRLIGSDLSHLAGTTYKWYVTGQNTIVGTDSVLDITAENTYSIVVEDPRGCKISDTVRINFAPTPDFVITGHENPNCSTFDTLRIERTNVRNMTINWFGNGVVSLSDSNKVAIVNVSGIYTATVTDNNTPAKCTYSQSVEVFVRPTIDLGLSATSDTLRLCQGDSLVLDAFHPEHNDDFDYKWRIIETNQVVSTNSSITINYEMVNNFTSNRFEIKVTDPNLAGGGSCSITDTIIVRFDRKTGVQIDSTFIKTLCLGQTQTLTAIGADEYEWSNGQLLQLLKLRQQNQDIIRLL